MRKKGKKIYIYSIVAGLSILIGSYFGPQGFNFDKPRDFKILETSVLHLLKSVANNTIYSQPDIAIEKVELKHISDPSDNFNYYKYDARVYLHNYGGDIKDAKVVLHTNSDKNLLFIRNDGLDFSLKKDDDYIVRRYEILFDAQFNGGEIDLEIELKDNVNEELDYKNNIYPIEFFEGNSKIDDLKLTEIMPDGSFIFDFNEHNYSFEDFDIELVFGNKLNETNLKTNYREVYIDNEIYEYNSIENSEFLINSGNWKTVKSDSRYPTVKVFDAPFNTEKTYYLYIKAVNRKNGYYKVSDILKFGPKPKEKLTRAQFAKLFVELASIDLNDEGLTLYEDINEEEWYSSAVQTIYNLGLTDISDFAYKPDEEISREEVIKTVLDYFDVDLSIADDVFRFQDIPLNHDLYPYAQALMVSDKGHALADFMLPKKAATHEYLKYLINEYR